MNDKKRRILKKRYLPLNLQLHVTCIMMEKIMCQVNFASKFLQTKDMDISRAVDSLKKLYDTLSKMRNDYNTLKNEALVLAIKWGVSKDFQEKEGG